MEAIETFLDNIFASFQQNEQVLALKSEMLTDMKEKYEVLIREGMSKEEAFGSVISNFGSIDEIRSELVLRQSAVETTSDISISKEEAFAYINLMKKSSIWIGIGVWLILTGVSILMLMNNIYNTWLFSSVGVFILLMFIAAAVALFISNGIHLNEYHDYKVKNLLLDKETRKKLTDDSKHFLSRFIVNIVIGVFSIMMTVGLNIIINAVFIGGTANLSGSLLIFIIGFSSFLFITSGMVKSSYDIVLGNGYYCDKVKNK